MRTSLKAVASLRMVTPGAEFCGVTLHILYIVIFKRLYLKDSGTTSLLQIAVVI